MGSVTTNQGFWIGQIIEVDATFQQDGINANPDSVTFYTLSPKTLTVTSYVFPNPAITNPAPGVFKATFPVNESGRWEWRWDATGKGATAIDGWVDVNPSKFVSE